MFVNHLIQLGEWGFPFSSLDLRITVKNYLERSCRVIKKFTNNTPGEEWARNFLKRHSHKIRQCACQNIKSSRANLHCDSFTQYFANLKAVVEDVPPSNLLNYDETNLSDDPGSEKLIFKHGKKYPERIMNYTKGNTSIMFSGTADGELLPVYVVYKAHHMWKSWTRGGPKRAQYNRSSSGWFDGICFDDWFSTVVVPWAKKRSGKKVVIGDNLSSHFSTMVLKMCEELNISFVCLVASSTHLSQPLDIAFYGPMKRKWRKILKNWKLKNPGKTSLLKDEFPILLKELCECFNCENLTAGFSASGIYPFCPDELYKKLPSAAADESINSVSDAFLDHLKSLRSPNEKSKRCQKRKRLNVEAGKSVSHEDLELSDEEEENKEKSWRKEENEKSGAEEEELNNDIEQDAASASTSTTCMKEMKYEEIKVGQWVKVIFMKKKLSLEKWWKRRMANQEFSVSKNHLA